MKFADIVLWSVLAACTYGIVHDQITVRICLEYFTVAHPPLFGTSSPTLLALCWGVAATAGIGAAFGIILALVARAGGPAPYPLPGLARHVVALLAVMGASALVSGIVGYQLSQTGLITLPYPLATTIPKPHHHRFMAVWFAHGASYIVGFSGGALLCFRVWRARGSPSVIALVPRTRAAVIRAAFIVALTVYVIWFRVHAS